MVQYYHLSALGHLAEMLWKKSMQGSWWTVWAGRVGMKLLIRLTFSFVRFPKICEMIGIRKKTTVTNCEIDAPIYKSTKPACDWDVLYFVL